VISYVLPTHARPAVLAETLARLGELEPHDARLIIADNASSPPVSAPSRLVNGVEVEVLRLEANISSAARNAAADRAIALAGLRGHWIVMLDDDSSPVSAGFLEALDAAPTDVGVVAAEVVLPGVRHEAGGLPEVFIGCGAAIRAEAWNTVGGYDADFDYYAEEYDLCARLILAGLRVAHDRRFTVAHRKVAEGRDMNRIVANLVRNNGWVMARYAPQAVRDELIREQITRYALIAAKENAVEGYERGLARLRRTLDGQPRSPMSDEQWGRFTGYAAALAHLAPRASTMGRVAVVQPGKNSAEVVRAARDAGVNLVSDERQADALLVGTLSPGPMLDARVDLEARQTRPVFTPWELRGATVPAAPGPRVSPSCSARARWAS
jgi:GT2 family glycosyltransferase